MMCALERSTRTLTSGVRSIWRSICRTLVHHVPGECERCPACASRRLYELDVLRFRSPHCHRTGFISGCNDCGIVFANPLPSTDALREFYSPSGEWGAARAGPPANAGDGAGRKLGRSLRRPFELIRDELRVDAPPPGARVLDFGCGAGQLLDALQAYGWETWGIEPALDHAFRRHRRLAGVPDEPTFDLIVVNHVLEHVIDPLGLLRQFARAARQPGYIFISVPRLDTLPIHRDLKYVINGRAHVMAYTWPSLQGLLARAGWAPVATPPDRLPEGRGHTTCSRLQVIARRVATPCAPMASPADAARVAMRQYHAGLEGRSVLERLEWYRVVARTADARRRHQLRIRKSAKHAAAGVVR